MDIQDYINKVNNLKNVLPNRLHESVYPEIAETTTKSLKNRIFTKGLDSDESKIGDYSEKPMNATKEQFVKKAAFTSTSKSGKTMKLKSGYKELKQVQGLKNESVNLVYSGDLRKSIQSNVDADGFVIGFTDKENADKAQKLEDKYGKAIFKLSDNEVLKMKQRVVTALKKIHKSIFYAD